MPITVMPFLVESPFASRAPDFMEAALGSVGSALGSMPRRCLVRAAPAVRFAAAMAASPDALPSDGCFRRMTHAGKSLSDQDLRGIEHTTTVSLRNARVRHVADWGYAEPHEAKLEKLQRLVGLTPAASSQRQDGTP